MNTLKINNPVKRQFAMVPNSLWSLDVSIQAKAILAYLCSLPDGSTVRVAQIEEALQIGRDCRRRAMKEMMKTGDPVEDANRVILLAYVATPDAKGRIVARQLVVDLSPLVVSSAGTESLPPENPSLGHLPPENPTVGKSTPVEREIRRTRGGFSGALLNTNIKTKEPAALNPGDLSRYGQTCLREGRPVPLGDGRQLKPGSPQFVALAKMITEGAPE